jgi:hypothetical protein
MSKINIPISTLPDSECESLFQSVKEKLNIHNPRFHYPIYNKIADAATATDQRGLVFDSKFKVKQILTKILDSDTEEYETDDDLPSDVEEKLQEYRFNIAGAESNTTETSTDNLNQEGESGESGESGGSGGSGGNDDLDLEDVLNTQHDVELVNDNIHDDLDDADDADDSEIDEAISNIFTAVALVERVNKATGEKTIKEEKIHIKKSPLLEPIKILKDEYLIPARLKNQNLADETLQRTHAKLESYNNSAHVEALFLYLGNKLVESGKCPSFPYYYGCINGEDPNYHHDITDEYDMVSRTKWFRQRVKTDFDLLILEGDEMDEAQREMENNLHRPQSHNRGRCSMSPGLEDSSTDISNDDTNNEDEADDSETEDIEKALAFLEKNGVGSRSNSSNDDCECDGECDCECDGDNKVEVLDGGAFENENVKKVDNVIPIDEIDSTLNTILADIEDKTAIADINNFIKDMDDIELDIEIDNDNENQNENQNENTNNSNDVECNVKESIVVSEDKLDDDLIEVLSDFDKDALTMSEFEDNCSNNQYYLKCAHIPVNLCMMEKLDQTLDNLLDDGYNMTETEWFSVFFQTAFGLAIAQKYFSFVHNDLHSSNIMFKATELKNLFFQIGNSYYRIPTFGKLTKIIDFARGTFKLGDRWIFSDQFKDDGDAWGQYDYPTDGSLANCEHKPNPSFDLVRLGTTVIQRMDDVPRVREFVESITKDDYDNSLCYEEDTFQLYIDIAHNAHNAIPIEVLGRPEFDKFKVAKDRVPKGVYVFKY